MRTSFEYPGRRRPATLGVLAALALGCTETVPFAPASLPRPSQVSESISQPGFHDRGLNRSLIYVYRVAAAAGGKQSGFSDSVAVSLDP